MGTEELHQPGGCPPAKAEAIATLAAPTPFRVFIGFDKRQPLAYTVARSSVERHASRRVQVEPLVIDWLPMKRRGLTDFTYTRWLVPWLCNFKGTALFMDPDTIARADVTELESIVNPMMAVSVVKGRLKFEWASVMYFQCDNASCQVLTPEYVANEQNQPPTFKWLHAQTRLGDLPPEWDHLVLYDKTDPAAKIIHYTAGIPCWPETKNSPLADLWHEEAQAALSTVSFMELMGKSVHRPAVEALNQATAPEVPI